MHRDRVPEIAPATCELVEVRHAEQEVEDTVGEDGTSIMVPEEEEALEELSEEAHRKRLLRWRLCRAAALATL